jgi:hypothetical protein
MEQLRRESEVRSGRPLRITHLSWGRIEVEGGRTCKDAKLWPGGVREWDWNETGTRHRPGFSLRMSRNSWSTGPRWWCYPEASSKHCRFCPETLELLLKNKGIPAHVLQTEGAVRLHNELAEKQRVAGLFHSTC